jgi:hypothetical protein
MDWTVLLGYFILLLIQYLAIQSLPIGLIGALFGKFRLFGILIGAIITWYFIDFAWMKIFGNHLPLLAFILSLTFQSWHLFKSKNELTYSSKFMIEGEMMGIFLVSLFILIFKQFNWY